MKRQLARFDAAEYLDSEEVIAEYLNAALADANPDVFLAAIGDVAKARGMTQLAKAAGFGRESLYKALAPGAKPRYDTVLKLVRALGVELHAVPAHSGGAPSSSRHLTNTGSSNHLFEPTPHFARLPPARDCR